MGGFLEEYNESESKHFQNKINNNEDEIHRADNFPKEKNYTLLDRLEIEEGSEENTNTSISGKIKKNIHISTVTEMVKNFISNHPETKEQLLQEIKKETDIDIDIT